MAANLLYSTLTLIGLLHTSPLVVQFIMESGIKLQSTSVSTATAAVIYHRFFQECSIKIYDPYLIASTAIYLAGKIEEDHKKIRDVINVCYRSLYKSLPPLELGEEYWSLRDSLAACELLVLRMLKFQVVISHPHRFLLHYMKALKDWLDSDLWNCLPIADTAWAFLQDFYHSEVCLNFKAEHVAISLLYLTIQCLGVEIPFNNATDKIWWKAFCHDITQEMIWTIVEAIFDIYKQESV